MIERREFVKGMAAAAVLPSAFAGAAELKKGALGKIVGTLPPGRYDCHTHIYDPQKKPDPEGAALETIHTIGWPAAQMKDHIMFGTDCFVTGYDAARPHEIMDRDDGIYRDLKVGADMIESNYRTAFEKYLFNGGGDVARIQRQGRGVLSGNDEGGRGVRLCDVRARGADGCEWQAQLERRLSEPEHDDQCQ